MNRTAGAWPGCFEYRRVWEECRERAEAEVLRRWRRRPGRRRTYSAYRHAGSGLQQLRRPRLSEREAQLVFHHAGIGADGRSRNRDVAFSDFQGRHGGQPKNQFWKDHPTSRRWIVPRWVRFARPVRLNHCLPHSPGLTLNTYSPTTTTWKFPADGETYTQSNLGPDHPRAYRTGVFGAAI